MRISLIFHFYLHAANLPYFAIHYSRYTSSSPAMQDALALRKSIFIHECHSAFSYSTTLLFTIEMNSSRGKSNTPLQRGIWSTLRYGRHITDVHRTSAMYPHFAFAGINGAAGTSFHHFLYFFHIFVTFSINNILDIVKQAP